MGTDDRTAETKEQPEKTTILGSAKDDGTIEIVFGESDMEAKADFHPPIGTGQVLTPEYIASMLERLNVVSGVDWDAIQNATLECNLNRKIVHGVVVARGEAPVAEIREYYETNPAFRKWPILPDGNVPRIDYREISPFILVKKGQILAKLRPSVSGKDGWNVHGEAIPKGFSKTETATSGPNTRIVEGSIVAACDGRLIEKGTELLVEEILEVKGSVGYKTGHIMFPGDVIIDGAVADGFRVYAGGSILSKQTFDATDVVAKKDLIVAGGVVGRVQASLKVGGCIRAKFIQNCRVAARGAVTIGSAVINSRVFTMDKLDLGDKGRIVGGEIFAVHGVRAAGIGSEAGSGTKIHCGIDFTAQQELDKANEQLRQFTRKQAKVREMMEKETERDPIKVEYHVRITDAIGVLSAKIAGLLGKLDSDDEASIEVTGEVRPGTLIEICHIAFFTDQPYKKVRFRLDKNVGRIIHENL